MIFAGATGALAEDNANFFWDDANNRLGIGTNLPLAPLYIQTADLGAGPGSGGIILNQTANNANTSTEIELHLAGVQAAVMSATTASFSALVGFPANTAFFYGSNAATAGTYIASIVASGTGPPLIFSAGQAAGPSLIERARFLGAAGSGSLAGNFGLGVTNPTAIL